MQVVCRFFLTIEGLVAFFLFVFRGNFLFFIGIFHQFLVPEFFHQSQVPEGVRCVRGVFCCSFYPRDSALSLIKSPTAPASCSAPFFICSSPVPSPVLTVLIILAITLSRVVISVWKRRALNISARSLPRSGFSRNFDHWVVVGIVSPIVGVIRVVRVVALAHRAGARWKIFDVVLFLTVL